MNMRTTRLFSSRGQRPDHCAGEPRRPSGDRLKIGGFVDYRHSLRVPKMLHALAPQLVVPSISIPGDAVGGMLQRIGASISTGLALFPAIPALGLAQLMRHAGPAAARYRPALLSWPLRPWPSYGPSIVPVHGAIHNSQIGTRPIAEAAGASVTTTSPADGTSVQERSTVTVSATASDNAGMTSAKFYVNANRACDNERNPRPVPGRSLQRPDAPVSYMAPRRMPRAMGALRATSRSRRSRMLVGDAVVPPSNGQQP
jgi:Bacterial Ig domain